jgi:hypothetical protein
MLSVCVINLSAATLSWSQCCRPDNEATIIDEARMTTVPYKQTHA